VADGSMSMAFRRWRTQDGRPGAPFTTAGRREGGGELKNLRPTISHPAGYALSPRGIAYLARTRYR